MTKKYKVLALVMIFLFIGHYFSTVTASELPENKPQDDDIVIEGMVLGQVPEMEIQHLIMDHINKSLKKWKQYYQN